MPNFFIAKIGQRRKSRICKKAWLNVQEKNMTGRADKMHKDNFGNFVIGSASWIVKLDTDGNVVYSFYNSSSELEDINTFGNTYLYKSTSELTSFIPNSRSYPLKSGIMQQIVLVN